jgi:hypothetical protein
MPGGTVTKSRLALQFTGGIAAPDGIEMDAEMGSSHLRVGVYRFEARMLPTHLVYSDDPRHLNLAPSAAPTGARSTSCRRSRARYSARACRWRG